MEVEQYLSCGQFRMAKPFAHSTNRNRTYGRAGLVDSSERDGKKTGVFDIVNPRHPNLTGHAHPQFVQRLQQVGGCEVIGANDAVGTELREPRLNPYPILGFYPADAWLKALWKKGFCV